MLSTCLRGKDCRRNELRGLKKEGCACRKRERGERGEVKGERGKDAAAKAEGKRRVRRRLDLGRRRRRKRRMRRRMRRRLRQRVRRGWELDGKATRLDAQRGELVGLVASLEGADHPHQQRVGAAWEGGRREEGLRPVRLAIAIEIAVQIEIEVEVDAPLANREQLVHLARRDRVAARPEDHGQLGVGLEHEKLRDRAWTQGTRGCTRGRSLQCMQLQPSTHMGAGEARGRLRVGREGGCDLAPRATRRRSLGPRLCSPNR